MRTGGCAETTHFLVAMRILGYSPKDLSPSQNQFVTNHLRRIKPTLAMLKVKRITIGFPKLLV